MTKLTGNPDYLGGFEVEYVDSAVVSEKGKADKFSEPISFNEENEDSELYSKSSVETLYGSIKEFAQVFVEAATAFLTTKSSGYSIDPSKRIVDIYSQA